MASGTVLQDVAPGTSTFDFYPSCNNHTGVLQISFGSGCTGTVALKGRLSSAHDWFTLSSSTADAMVEIIMVPFMQISYATSGGTFTASVWESA